MRRLFLLLILLMPGNSVAFQIIEFCPDPYLPDDPDEYMVIEGVGSLDGVIISDGEGGFRFPPGTVMSGRLSIARNGEAYTRTHGGMPDFEWYNFSPQIPDVIRSGNLQLSNTGDQLQLYQDGMLVQEIVWPGELAARQGQIHYFEEGIWDRRPFMIGQSRFKAAIFENVSGIVFASPDCSMEVYTEFVSSAEHELLVNVYEFSSMTMAGKLLEAHERGVSITVLLEGGPVGGVSEEEKRIIAWLQDDEIPVYFMEDTPSAHSPYRFNHAKYMVADRERILVTSENFKQTGFPEQGTRGNRGWGVVIEDPRTAEYLSEVFRYDSGGAWVISAEGGNYPEDQVQTASYQQKFTPLEFSDSIVIPVISPDTSCLVEEMISGAEKSIDIEQAYITNQSGDLLNPFLQAALNASKRGVRVRILLDSSYFNIEEDSDNDEMVRLLNNIAADQHLPLEARCADLEGNNLEKIHNKGVIVDQKSVLVSSINWNTNSPQFNREAGLIIIHPVVADYFSAVFEEDWEGRDPTSAQGGPDLQKIGIATAVVLVLVLLQVLRRRKRF
jgi:cardiolipin synthase